MRRVGIVLGGLLALALLAAACVAWLNLRGEDALPTAPAAFVPTPGQVARGEYLARAGNCISCHTARGGAPFAGGRAIETPFGSVYASNLTPDERTGLGGWSADAFWRALHNGRSQDGRLLYPAFPYPNYTHVTREDSDAIFAYLRSLPAVEQARRPHALRFPYGTQAALAVWRALFFTPGALPAEPQQSAEWQRGAYLVRGLGHCSACHTARNALGAGGESLELSGGLIPVQNWYAPALNAAAEAGVVHWSEDDVVALLRTGVAPQGSVAGPMAEVVFRSTQYLDDADLRAMATFLRALPQQPAAAPGGAAAPQAVLQRGATVYEQHCASCHGKDGRGTPGAFPALAGNRAVTLATPVNVLHTVLQGGYAPATEGNPRPFGMPPFTQVLDDDDVAAVASYIRSAWGNQAAPVGVMDVYRARGARGS